MEGSEFWQELFSMRRMVFPEGVLLKGRCPLCPVGILLVHNDFFRCGNCLKDGCGAVEFLKRCGAKLFTDGLVQAKRVRDLELAALDRERFHKRQAYAYLEGYADEVQDL